MSCAWSIFACISCCSTGSGAAFNAATRPSRTDRRTLLLPMTRLCSRVSSTALACIRACNVSASILVDYGLNQDSGQNWPVAISVGLPCMW